jgi:hypothetical protein
VGEEEEERREDIIRRGQLRNFKPPLFVDI